MIKRIKTRGGDEWDALSPTRKYHSWRRGELRRIKRGYNKRLRKALNLRVRKEDDL